ncbi:MAG: YaaA family protein [Muribaculaceae bacterium]|nr:YaaA family protein [Muribaculaceae bacterium]
MKLLLSPSKQMGGINALTTASIYSQPLYTNDAEIIVKAILETPLNELINTLKSSREIARSALEMAYDYFASDKGSIQAILSYSGVAYKELKANDFNVADQEYAQSTLLIGSAVYGILRPYDLIKPYRLDLANILQIGGAKISLQKYWKEKVSLFLYNDIDDSRILLNIASNETMQLIDTEILSDINIVNVRFLQNTNKGLRMVPSVIAKKARGAFARYCIKNKCTIIEDVIGFDSMSMRYNAALSDSKDIIFIYQ